MYVIPQAVQKLFEDNQPQVLRITGTDRNGRAIAITEADVMNNTFAIDRYCINGEKLEIGTAIASEMTLTLDNEDGKFSSVVFEGTELNVRVGIADWTQENPTVTWIPCGYFTCDRQPRRLTTIKLNALDRMTRFHATLVTATPWTDEHGNVFVDEKGNVIIFESQLTFPTTIAGLVSQVAELCGVPFTQDISALPNAGYTLSQMPEMQQGYTLCNLIQWCAGCMGTNAWINWSGNLIFSWSRVTGKLFTAANRYNSDLAENDITVTGVTYTNNQGAVIVAGTTRYALDMTGNVIAGSGIAEILPNVNTALNGFTYRPFEAVVDPVPYLWPMDVVVYQDKDGVNHSGMLTHVNFGINGTATIASRGETEQSNSMASSGGLTPQQAHLITEAIEKAASEIEADLDQETIFNILTDGGKSQGLYLSNGLVYLNATYIQAGTLSANYIKGGTLVLGGSNNVNGQLIVKDANGATIGTLNSAGLSILQGAISANLINGGTLTLGGQNNVDGQLIVKDANGNTIGTLNNQGLSIEIGSISADLIDSGEMSASRINGGALILGGANNTNGRLEIVDSNDDTVGEWNKDGITIYHGIINMDSTSTIEQKFDSSGDYYFVLSGNDGLQIINYDYAIQLWYNDLISGVTPYPELLLDAYNDGEASLSTQGMYVKLSSSEQMVYDNACFGVFGDNNLFVNTNNADTTAGGKTFYANEMRWTGDFIVTGTKNREVFTADYGQRRLYAYETPTPMFGDVGEGMIGEDGLCYVSIDPVFAQTVNTAQYQVFLQKYGEGDAWVTERRGGWFIVEGTPGLAFGWEIKARQRDYEQRRLDKGGARFSVPRQSYGAAAARHVSGLARQRLMQR